MNRLDPELKRLMARARHAPTPVDKTPFGFSGRAVANYIAQKETMTQYLALQRLLKFSTWISVILIFCAGIFFTSQSHDQASLYNFMSPFQFVARSFVP